MLKSCRQAIAGQEPSLGFLPQCGGSTWAFLRTGRSIGAPNSFRPNCGYAALPSLTGLK